MKISKKAQRSTRSAIGAMLSAAEGKSCISFAGGLPDESLFPCKELGSLLHELITFQGQTILRYGEARGSASLRKVISERMTSHGLGEVTADHLIITNGSQQGIDIMAKALIDEGDVILIESPSYVDALNVFKSYGATLQPVPADKEGMIPNELERILQTHDKIKGIYVITDFQNPTGKRWSLERRQALLDLASRYDVVVIDDNPYGELNYDGAYLPSLFQLDTTGHTVFLGSFSKTVAPGVRIGWIAGREPLLSILTLLKEGSDIHSAHPTQEAVAEYMKLYDLDEHIEEICKVYKKRRDLMNQALQDYFPKGAKWTCPEGGFFFWVELPEEINATERINEAIDRGVVYVPGTAFYAEGGHHHTLRLNFTHVPEEDIAKGIEILGAVLAE